MWDRREYVRVLNEHREKMSRMEARRLILSEIERQTLTIGRIWGMEQHCPLCNEPVAPVCAALAHSPEFSFEKRVTVSGDDKHHRCPHCGVGLTYNVPFFSPPPFTWSLNMTEETLNKLKQVVRATSTQEPAAPPKPAPDGPPNAPPSPSVAPSAASSV